jgi:hypothetical protein
MGVVYEDEGEVESKPFAAGKGETGSLALRVCNFASFLVAVVLNSLGSTGKFPGTLWCGLPASESLNRIASVRSFTNIAHIVIHALSCTVMCPDTRTPLLVHCFRRSWTWTDACARSTGLGLFSGHLSSSGKGVGDVSNVL